jgi:hypothetical protein
MKKRVVQLKDQSTSFHDFDTGFDIVRSQKKELGENVGRATAIALQHGRLIAVDVADAEEEKSRKGHGKEKND